MNFANAEFINLWRACCALSGQHWSDITPSQTTIECAEKLCLAIDEERLVAYRFRQAVTMAGKIRIGPRVILRMVARRADQITDWAYIRENLVSFEVKTVDLKAVHANGREEISNSTNLWADQLDLRVSPSQAHEPDIPKLEGHDKPWLIKNPDDPETVGFQPWYTPARYFARELVRSDAVLLTKRDILAEKVSGMLAGAGFYKRGPRKESLDPGTVKKAFVNVRLA